MGSVGRLGRRRSRWRRPPGGSGAGGASRAGATDSVGRGRRDGAQRTVAVRWRRPARPRAPARTTSSSWKRRPPGPSRAGSIAARRRPNAVSAAVSRVAALGQAGHEAVPDGLHDLVEERPDVAAALVEFVEDRQAGQPIAVDERPQEAVDRLAAGQAEGVADAVGGQPLAGAGQQLVEHRLGVAHAAGGEAGDEGDRVVVGLAAISARGCGAACPRSGRP